MFLTLIDRSVWFIDFNNAVFNMYVSSEHTLYAVQLCKHTLNANNNCKQQKHSAHDGYKSPF